MSEKESKKELLGKFFKVLALLIILLSLLIGGYWLLIDVDWRIALGSFMLGAGRGIAKNYDYLTK